MRIDSSGNVGIGTTTINTSHNRALSIFGANSSQLQLQATNFGGTASDGGAALTYSFGSLFLVNNNTNGDIHFMTKASGASLTEKMIITESGKVGIGKTNPVNSLDVVGSISATGAQGNTAYADGVFLGTVSGVPAITAGKTGTSSFSPLIFRQDNESTGTERMRIDSSGNLVIKGQATSDNNRMELRVEDSVNKFIGSSNSTTNKSFQFFSSNTGVSRIATLDADGLKFNADTSADNALDDYEEGTPFTSTGNATVNNSAYTKVGKMVTITFRISVSAGNTQTMTLPFVHAGNSGDHVVGVVVTAGTFKEIILGNSSNFTLDAGFSKGTLTYPTT